MCTIPSGRVLPKKYNLNEHNILNPKILLLLCGLAGALYFLWPFIITGIKVINIIEENGSAIEKMASKAIDDIYNQNKKILDIQTTADNLIFIFGEKVK